MRLALVQSLSYIYATGLTPRSFGARELDSALSEIAAHRILPGVFRRYYDMVFAAKDRRIIEAQTLFDEIVDLSSLRPSLSVLPYGDKRLGADAERYGRLLELGEDAPVLFTTPDPNLWSSFERTTAEALALIEDADSVLAEEFRSLVVQIIATVPSTMGATRDFDGASSFMLWGAIFINAARLRTPLGMVETLVHEAAHQVLFGHSHDDVLVENVIEDRFESPLRRDPRPMIGVFHATFVCARVHYALNRVKAVRKMDRAIIEDRLVEQRRLFDGGVETVRQYGMLTPRGAQILGAAQDYMADAA